MCIRDSKEKSTRLCFNVLEIEEHGQENDPRTGVITREEGKATAPAPGSEPEYALFPDKWGISTRVLLAFLKAAAKLSVNEANALTAEKIKGWYRDGTLEGAIVRVDFVGKVYKGTTYFNPVRWESVDPKKLSKAAKAKLIS